jgi:hypothetical protein
MGAEMSMAMDLRSPDREPHLGELTRILRAVRSGRIDRAEGGRRLAALRSLMERERMEDDADDADDSDDAVDESASEARAYDEEHARLRRWALRERGIELPSLEEHPLRPIRPAAEAPVGEPPR